MTTFESVCIPTDDDDEFNTNARRLRRIMVVVVAFFVDIKETSRKVLLFVHFFAAKATRTTPGLVLMKAIFCDE
jgi:hypothetical protein